MAPNDHRLFSVVENSVCPDCDRKLRHTETNGQLSWLIDQGLNIMHITQGGDGTIEITMWNDNALSSDRGCYVYVCTECATQFEAYCGVSNDWVLAEGKANAESLVVTEEE